MILGVFLPRASPVETPQETVGCEQNLGIEILLIQAISQLLAHGEQASEVGCWLESTFLVSLSLLGFWLGQGNVPPLEECLEEKMPWQTMLQARSLLRAAIF